MVHSFESRLQKLFSEHGDALRVADRVLKDWNEGRLSWSDQERAGLFLVQTGFFKALFDQISKLSKKGQKIPWGSFAEALGITQASLTKEDIDNILLGAAEEEALPSLLRSWALDHLDPRFAKIRSSLKVTTKRETTSVLSSSNTKTHRQIETLEDTKSGNVPFEVLKELAEEQESPSHAPDYTSLYQVQENLAEQNMIAEQFLTTAKANPNQAYEIAINLHMMGLSREALKLIPLCKDDPRTQWLEVEIMIGARDFLGALEKVEQIEKDIPEGSQIEVEAMFFKALIVKGLKQDSLAINLMEQVVAIQPQYKSASTILYEWKESKK